jgi:mono/diheme cytochrome c family protein
VKPFVGALVAAAVLTACGGDFERMREQQRYDPYGASGVFTDGKVMQRAPAATVPVENDVGPDTVDLPLVQLGQSRFDVYCSPCHGVTGDARTPIAARMPLRQPPSLHESRIVALSREELYGVVTNGYGFMPPYSIQLTARERWAVAAYVRALQISQSTTLEALPRDVQQEARATLAAVVGRPEGRPLRTSGGGAEEIAVNGGSRR